MLISSLPSFDDNTEEVSPVGTKRKHDMTAMPEPKRQRTSADDYYATTNWQVVILHTRSLSAPQEFIVRFVAIDAQDNQLSYDFDIAADPRRAALTVLQGIVQSNLYKHSEAHQSFIQQINQDANWQTFLAEKIQNYYQYLVKFGVVELAEIDNLGLKILFAGLRFPSIDDFTNNRQPEQAPWVDDADLDNWKIVPILTTKGPSIRSWMIGFFQLDHDSGKIIKAYKFDFPQANLSKHHGILLSIIQGRLVYQVKQLSDFLQKFTTIPSWQCLWTVPSDKLAEFFAIQCHLRYIDGLDDNLSQQLNLFPTLKQICEHFQAYVPLVLSPKPPVPKISTSIFAPRSIERPTPIVFPSTYAFNQWRVRIGRAPENHLILTFEPKPENYSSQIRFYQCLLMAEVLDNKVLSSVFAAGVFEVYPEYTSAHAANPILHIKKVAFEDSSLLIRLQAVTSWSVFFNMTVGECRARISALSHEDILELALPARQASYYRHISKSQPYVSQMQFFTVSKQMLSLATQQTTAEQLVTTINSCTKTISKIEDAYLYGNWQMSRTEADEDFSLLFKTSMIINGKRKDDRLLFGWDLLANITQSNEDELLSNQATLAQLLETAPQDVANAFDVFAGDNPTNAKILMILANSEQEMPSIEHLANAILHRLKQEESWKDFFAMTLKEIMEMLPCEDMYSPSTSRNNDEDELLQLASSSKSCSP